jgi:hypothetical protein
VKTEQHTYICDLCGARGVTDVSYQMPSRWAEVGYKQEGSDEGRQELHICAHCWNEKNPAQLRSLPAAFARLFSWGKS